MAARSARNTAMGERPGELSAELHVSFSISWGFFLSNRQRFIIWLFQLTGSIVLG